MKAVPGGSYASVLNVMDGTVRIDDYAGNSNTHIASIVLPDGLKRIGQYAFYGYTALKSVEFKSVVAPAMEDSYKKDAKLTENDPGYEKLHNQFDIFGYELYYFNFIDLLGKKEPIQMILPNNADVEGYDSLVYEVYFGKVEDALRSDYVAMQNSMLTFYEYAQQVAKLKNVTLVNEKRIFLSLPSSWLICSRTSCIVARSSMENVSGNSSMSACTLLTSSLAFANLMFLIVFFAACTLATSASHSSLSKPYVVGSCVTEL